MIPFPVRGSSLIPLLLNLSLNLWLVWLIKHFRSHVLEHTKPSEKKPYISAQVFWNIIFWNLEVQARSYLSWDHNTRRSHLRDLLLTAPAEFRFQPLAAKVSNAWVKPTWPSQPVHPPDRYNQVTLVMPCGVEKSAIWYLTGFLTHRTGNIYF